MRHEAQPGGGAIEKTFARATRSVDSHSVFRERITSSHSRFASRDPGWQHHALAFSVRGLPYEAGVCIPGRPWACVADSHTITSAARLVRCHFDMQEARLHELTLPLIVQKYLEAFCHIWRVSEVFMVLEVPGTAQVHAGKVRIPGGTDAARISIGCRRDDDRWLHSCALGKHDGREEVEAWVAKYGNAYEAEQIWAEPAVFALYQTQFQLEHRQFQAIGFGAGKGLEPYNAALAAVRWHRALQEDDPKAAYRAADEALPARMRVTPGVARRVLVRSEHQPRVACPDVIPLRVLRNRPSLSAMKAICSHLVDERGFSMPDVAARLGISKGSVQDYVEAVRLKHAEAGVPLRRHLPERISRISGSTPAPATGGGDAHSEE